MAYLKLSPEYECSPLWISPDNNIYENLAIEASPFDGLLKKRLTDWAEKFEGTLDQDYPPDSGFKTVPEEKDFERAGVDIWKDILSHHPKDYEKVFFSSYLLKKLYSDLSAYENDLRNIR